jgi:uncharacterized membrane protein
LFFRGFRGFRGCFFQGGFPTTGTAMKLSEQDKSHISQLAAQVETHTGTQVMAVVTGKSDTYPEIPWKAFSLGVALATTALIIAAYLGGGRGRFSLLLWGAAVPGSGIVLAMASIFFWGVARPFLGKERASEETRQFARSLFLERGLSRTGARRGVLMLVSQLERRASIVVDTGILDRIPQAELDGLTAAVEAQLDCTSAAAALSGGLTSLEGLLVRHGFAATGGPDEVTDEFLEKEGPQS